MARHTNLAGEWHLLGQEPWNPGVELGPFVCRVPGDVRTALETTPLVSSPHLPATLREHEWISRRTWRYERTFTLAEEPQEGRSEKYFLTACISGYGSVWIDGIHIGKLHGAWRQDIFDVTRLLEAGGLHSISLCIDRPIDDEGPIPLAGVCMASIDSISFAKINSLYATADQHGQILVDTTLTGYTQGRITCKYRVMLGQTLVASIDVPEKLIADRQTFAHTIPMEVMLPWLQNGEEANVYTVRLTVERGGIRCDMAQCSVADVDLSFVPLQGNPSGFPYTILAHGKTHFMRGINVLTPISQEDLRSLASTKANLVRFHGTLPPDPSLYDLCDSLGLLVWQEVPPDVQAAKDTAHRMAMHPSCAIVSFGHGLKGTDALPISPSHPRIIALRQTMLAICPRLHILPSSPAGLISIPTMQDFGRGLCQDTHGPLCYSQDLTTSIDANDSLLLSKIGFPAPQSFAMEQGTMQDNYGAYLCEMERLCGVFAQDEKAIFLRIGRHLQAQALRYAILSARRREGSTCAGTIVWCGNLPYPCAVSHALLDHGGLERPSLHALRSAYAPYAISAQMEQTSYLRGETIAAHIFLHTPPDEHGMFSVSASLCDIRGVALEEALWQIRSFGACTPCGHMSVTLAFDAPEVLLLRLQVTQNDQELARDHYILTIPKEGQPLYEPLRTLPAQQPVLSQREDMVEMQNDCPNAILGLTVHAGSQLLLSGMLMPWEKSAFALPMGVLLESLRVEALNIAPK